MLKIMGRATSSNVQKVVWLCAEIGLAVERTDIGGPYGGNDRPEYLALNPNGLVPSLIHDGAIILDSSVIMEYLDEIFPDTSMVPADPVSRHGPSDPIPRSPTSPAEDPSRLRQAADAGFSPPT